MTRIVAVIGAVTPPGRLSAAVNEAATRASASGHQVTILDLSSLRLDFADGRPPSEHDDDSGVAVEAVRQSEAVLLASPVYRGSYTGALKNFLDVLPIEALQGKPVGIAAMGATQHHYLGVDFHLRDVLAWFGALVAPTSVYLASSDFSDGKPSANAAASLDQLVATLATLAAATKGETLGPPPLAAQQR
jgi:FMN reductase